MFGCLKGIIVLVLVAVLAVAGWFYRDRLSRAWDDLRGAEAARPVTPADLEKSARAKLASIADGAPPEQVALSSDEVQALLKTQFANMLPGYVDSARVELTDGRVRLRARVPTDELPDISGLGQVASLLPDTTEITVTGQIIPMSAGRVAVGVDQVTAAKIPLPKKLVPQIIRRIRKKPEPNLPPDAISMPLPAGASTAYVRGDSLIFVTGRK